MGSCHCTLPTNKGQSAYENKIKVELKKQLKSNCNKSVVNKVEKTSECAEAARPLRSNTNVKCTHIIQVNSESEEDSSISPLPTLRPFDTNEAWNTSGNKDSGELEVNEIQEAINQLRSTSIYSSIYSLDLTDDENKTRQGSNLISEELVDALTETEIEESQHKMQAQMSYLQEQLSNNTQPMEP